jgi:hypothetical protein
MTGDMSKVQQTLDAEPKSSHKNSTGHKRAQEEPSDADVDTSETSDMYNLPMSLKYRMTLWAAKTPEVTFRKEHSDIDKLVMAIGSLTTSMHESHESKQKFCEDVLQAVRICMALVMWTRTEVWAGPKGMGSNL